MSRKRLFHGHVSDDVYHEVLMRVQELLAVALMAIREMKANGVTCDEVYEYIRDMMLPFEAYDGILQYVWENEAFYLPRITMVTRGVVAGHRMLCANKSVDTLLYEREGI